MQHPWAIAVAMVCSGGPTYFSTYKYAAIDYTRPVACNQAQRGIATVVLLNSLADVGTGGSGAASAGLWA